MIREVMKTIAAPLDLFGANPSQFVTTQQPMDMIGRPAVSRLEAPSVNGPAFNTRDFPAPGIPFPPFYEGVVPRAFDFPSSVNLQRTPRAGFGDQNAFSILAAVTRQNDVLQYAIRARSDEMASMEFTFQPRDPLVARDPFVLARINEARKFWEKPNRLDNLRWDQWLFGLLFEIFVTDAMTVYPQFDKGGRVHSFCQVDGKTIKLLIDNFGHTPQAPNPAYEQVIHGIIRGSYDANELFYRPTNPQVDSPYGRSLVEMCLLHIVMGIRRWCFNLSYYTDGSIPRVFVQVPDMAPDSVRMWFDLLNEQLTGDDAARWRLVPLPPNASPKEIKEPVWSREQDEWIARVICAMFSVNPMPFVTMQNRATAEVAEGMNTDLGTRPLKATISSIVTELEEQRAGDDLLKFAWVIDETDVSPERAGVLQIFMNEGILRRSYVSEQILGMAPDDEIRALPVGPIVSGVPALPMNGEGSDEEPAAAVVEAGISFNELTLALERMKALGDEGMINDIRGAIASRLGLPAPPPLAIQSDAEEEVAIEEKKAEIEKPADGELYKAARSELATWRRVVAKNGPARSFVNAAIPDEIAADVRASLVDGADPDAVFKAAEDRLKKRPGQLRNQRRIQSAVTAYLAEIAPAILAADAPPSTLPKK
jgi:hypothetical protein